MNNNSLKPIKEEDEDLGSSSQKSNKLAFKHDMDNLNQIQDAEMKGESGHQDAFEDNPVKNDEHADEAVANFDLEVTK